MVAEPREPQYKIGTRYVQLYAIDFVLTVAARNFFELAVTSLVQFEICLETDAYTTAKPRHISLIIQASSIFFNIQLTEHFARDWKERSVSTRTDATEYDLESGT